MAGYDRRTDHSATWDRRNVRDVQRQHVCERDTVGHQLSRRHKSSRLNVFGTRGTAPNSWTNNLIWTDPGQLPWSDAEREMLGESEETRYLLEQFPSGVHARPEGGGNSDIVLILWTYDVRNVVPIFPFDCHPHYPEIAMRGLSVMIPGLEAYAGHLPKPFPDGGYYTKTRENRPLIGPLPVEGAYVIGALSGYGLMAACAAGELLAAHLTGSTLPEYEPGFRLERYQDPDYRKLLETWDQASGQI